jgi:hypothetical protein
MLHMVNKKAAICLCNVAMILSKTSEIFFLFRVSGFTNERQIKLIYLSATLHRQDLWRKMF